jgi:hypothetical protein
MSRERATSSCSLNRSSGRSNGRGPSSTLRPRGRHVGRQIARGVLSTEAPQAQRHSSVNWRPSGISGKFAIVTAATAADPRALISHPISSFDPASAMPSRTSAATDKARQETTLVPDDLWICLVDDNRAAAKPSTASGVFSIQLLHDGMVEVRSFFDICLIEPVFQCPR